MTEKRARLPLAAVVRDDFLMSKEEYDEFIAKEEVNFDSTLVPLGVVMN